MEEVVKTSWNGTRSCPDEMDEVVDHLAIDKK